ncbi:hypothetical protein S7S_16410 [Isoalcanivorax pacificus W11-5]|uniref:Transposase IS200-like domain-containing protein n=1 Tax=Isoalcanivorax pacificus W11-5 TaxID=391936 RepID=A0A0B4XMS2_9GAMM|nr:transposase [Isoalcanivorax pacificus]AJD49694.1 hypothetical protein S7S_16410 [Isoalcanivorax pacificus W11-5]
MTTPRSQQISLSDTPYYHCIGRCVRRAFLCGQDDVSGVSYEHRRAWVQERLALLTEVFAIDLCAYAIMSNHYHLVLRINPAKSEDWSDEEVAARWLRLFAGPPIVHNWLAGHSPDDATATRAREEVQKWRARLSDLSWFMKCLNEYIARRSNEEDCCTGHFWEGRFKAQPLLDEAAVLRCMAYVDLNPVRAGMAVTPEASEYTSIKQRIEDLKDNVQVEEGPQLMPLSGSVEQEQEDTLLCGYRLLDYLELVDWTARAVLPGKRGALAESVPSILRRLGIPHAAWLKYMAPRPNSRMAAVGSARALRQYADCTGRKWVHGECMIAGPRILAR